MRTMSPEVVRDAMVPEPTTLAAEASAQELGRCFADNDDVRAIFVTEDDGRLLGVVTRKTLVREVVRRNAARGVNYTYLCPRGLAGDSRLEKRHRGTKRTKQPRFCHKESACKGKPGSLLTCTTSST